MRSPISCAPFPGCSQGARGGGRRARRKPYECNPRPSPFDVRKLLLLSIALLSLASAPVISGAAKVVPKRTTKPARRAEKPIVRRWLSSLTLSQKVAQLVVIPFYGEAPNTRSRQYQRFLRLVRDERVGGLILINRLEGHGIKRAEPYALAAFLNRMQRIASIPLL